MEGLPPEHLDMDMLIASLVQRETQLATFQPIVDNMEPGEERDAWVEEVDKIKAEVTDLKQLIEEKRESERDPAVRSDQPHSDGAVT